MKIVFIDNAEIEYNSRDRHNSKLRGAEAVIINMAESLANLNHQACIINNCPKDEKINNVNWINIKKIRKEKIKIDCDAAIANANANNLSLVLSKKKFVLSYSIQRFEKFIRKGQLLPFMIHKPKIIVLGKYHYTNRSRIISIFGKEMLAFATDKMFMNETLLDFVPNTQVIFSSRPDRNLDLLLNVWNEKISNKCPNVKLLINPPYTLKEKDKNIVVRRLSDQKDLLNDLKISRAMLIPGHKAELFCLAAEEAKQMCVPIVTYGIGCLYERVVDKVTGFIAKNDDEFAKYSLDLINDDGIWKEMRNNLLKDRGKRTWNIVAQDLLEIINK
jgi:glycosyltransferase involved in cell wall biosynthesis